MMMELRKGYLWEQGGREWLKKGTRALPGWLEIGSVQLSALISWNPWDLCILFYITCSIFHDLILKTMSIASLDWRPPPVQHGDRLPSEGLSSGHSPLMGRCWERSFLVMHMHYYLVLSYPVSYHTFQCSLKACIKSYPDTLFLLMRKWNVWGVTKPLNGGDRISTPWPEALFPLILSAPHFVISESPPAFDTWPCSPALRKWYWAGHCDSCL